MVLLGTAENEPPATGDATTFPGFIVPLVEFEEVQPIDEVWPLKIEFGVAVMEQLGRGRTTIVADAVTANPAEFCTRYE